MSRPLPPSQIDRYPKWRERVISFLGDRCAECGSDERLEVDHIDPASKAFNPLVCSQSWARTVEELKKCQLLCYFCHQRKTVAANRKDIAHGTLTMYVYRKCRCVECRAESARYHRERKRRLRVAG